MVRALIRRPSRSVWLVVVASSMALLGIGRPARAEPVIPPYDLWEVGPVSDPAPGPDLDPAWKILHRERTRDGLWLLLARPGEESGSGPAGWGRARRLGRVEAGERTVYFAPPHPDHDHAGTRIGRAMTVTPRGGTIRASRTHPARIASMYRHCFQVLDHAGPPPAFAPLAPPAFLAPSLARARGQADSGPAARTAQDVADLVAKVRLDSLEKWVRRLSELPSGQPAHRYWEDTPIEQLGHELKTRFEDYLGAGSVSEHFFTLENEEGVDVTVSNIAARWPSARSDAPAVLVTAHFDAIGVRSDPVELCGLPQRLAEYPECDCTADADEIRGDPACDWNWRYDPAPGADDNATGIAAMLEMARVLGEAGTSFDFDLIFVAFQAEELGLLGSAAFADSVAQSDQEVLFVFNMDMLGYNALRNEVDVVTNETSEWLADWIVETGELFVPSLPVEKLVTNFGRSDHASFWSIGVDAVLLLEDVALPYPGYHQWDDLWETMFPEEGPPGNGRPNSELQLTLSTQLGLATIARFAVHYEDPDLAIPAGELEISPLAGSAFAVGRGARLRARVHNLGSASLTFLDDTLDTLSARVTFYDGDPDAGGATLASVTERRYFAAGGVVPFEAMWTPPEGAEGPHEIWAVVEGLDDGYDLREVTDANNATSAALFVEASTGIGPSLLRSYVFPNPMTSGIDAMSLFFELTKNAGVRIRVWDLEGQEVGYFGAGRQFIAEGNRAGPNVVHGHDFRWASSDLESGVYLYSIQVESLDGEPTDHREGKFALVR